jgi:hypothetical protein
MATKRFAGREDFEHKRTARAATANAGRAGRATNVRAICDGCNQPKRANVLADGRWRT